jgi:predicted RNase H-like nuclease (RuvC/YqgF family)
MGVEQVYINLVIINSSLELRIKLVQEETINISNKEKIRKLEKEIEQCELYIKYLEKNLVSREDEIERLKVECQSIISELENAKIHLEFKRIRRRQWLCKIIELFS